MRTITRAALGILIPVVVYSYSGGPPNGKTGAPGEGTCHDCHTSFELNSGPGIITITAPLSFEAGMTYPIIVGIAHEGQSRWGFEFTPLTLGTCAVIDPVNTQMEVESGKTYVKHTSTGTYAGIPNLALWTFTWTAPAQPPDVVTFYAATNAANGNGSTSGDYIYTASVQVPRAQSAEDPAPLPENVLLFSAPNPVRERVLISYRVPEPGETSLQVYDMAGSLVARLVDESRPAGTWAVSWDSRDLSGTSVPDGTYLCRLATGARIEIRPLIVLR